MQTWLEDHRAWPKIKRKEEISETEHKENRRKNTSGVFRLGRSCETNV